MGFRSNWLNFPVHIATATSHAILAVMSGLAVLQHWLKGSLEPSYFTILLLAPSVILGAQVGARLAKRVADHWILRALSLGLMAVGLRLIYTSLPI